MTDFAVSWYPSDGLAALTQALAAAMEGGPAVVIGPPPDHAIADTVALVVRTSGSTGTGGRPVALTAHALTASADATHARLGGPGNWLLALPPTHIGGLQVLLRALRAKTRSGFISLTDGFDPAELATGIDGLDGGPAYLSLVPTQLYRALQHSAATAALARAQAVLIGGAHVPPDVAARAREAGINLVVTYGMTETSGGCIYDGRALDSVQVRTESDRVLISGPVLAEGYLDDGPQPFTWADGTRWLRTQDLGFVDDAGTLHVLGRADEVLITGGIKVHPAQVERRLAPLLGEVVVVGVPDPEWGTLVTAVSTTDRPLTQVRAFIGGGPAAPRALVYLPTLPLRGPGKVDRREAARLAGAALASGLGQRL
ncbi:MAG: AMP-binding protein [Beutenbergiaceae bacterium]